MTERIKLNKVSLREQKQKLGLYRRFLPALEARKQQFLLQLGVVRKDIQMRQEALTDLLKEIEPWSALIWDHEPLMRYFLEIEEVRSSVHNVADSRLFREADLLGAALQRLCHGIQFRDGPGSIARRNLAPGGAPDSERAGKNHFRRIPQDKPEDQSVRAAADPAVPGGASENRRVSAGSAGGRRRCGQDGQTFVQGYRTMVRNAIFPDCAEPEQRRSWSWRLQK